MSQKRYVLGFAFKGDEVLLIRKNKPDFMAGKLNGIGGKVEKEDITIHDAMCREFLEETGVITCPEEHWTHYASFYDKHCLVYCFKAMDVDIKSARSIESEVVGVYKVDTLHRERTMGNLDTLIRMALQPQFRFATFELSNWQEPIQTHQCGFDEAWIGKCKKEVVPGTNRCTKHADIKCRCGNQATHNCSQTMGPMVCGAPLCPKCAPHHRH